MQTSSYHESKHKELAYIKFINSHKFLGVYISRCLPVQKETIRSA